MIREIRDRNGDLIDVQGVADWTARWVLVFVALLLLLLTGVTLSGLAQLEKRVQTIEQGKR